MDKIFLILVYYSNEVTLITCKLEIGRSKFEPKYRLERCQKVKGVCKPFCDDVEYDYGYCIKWRDQCCV
ncbi:beta-defensin 110-like [Erinaceus europaeus]|uniref:Beta-defensin n=1 Tax=Erinaceus europaeus TaxID=9365 RepID=A0A1S3WVF3_ERIEU|nr:beta-defensin 110-like [Erinaceus europaeus]